MNLSVLLAIVKDFFFYSPKDGSTLFKLDKVDLLKLGRLLVLSFLGAFVATYTAATQGVDAVHLQQVLVMAAQAGLMAAGTTALDLLRRLLTNNAQ